MTIAPKTFVEMCECTDETPDSEPRCSPNRAVLLDAVEPLFNQVAKYIKGQVERKGLKFEQNRIEPFCVTRETESTEDGWLDVHFECRMSNTCEGTTMLVGYMDRNAKSLADLIIIDDSNKTNGRTPLVHDERGMVVGGDRDYCNSCEESTKFVRNAIESYAGIHSGSVDWAFQALKKQLGANDAKWLIDGIVEVGELAALFGPPKSGKSLLALEWAANLAAEGKRVLYLDEENSPSSVFERLEDMGADMGQIGQRLRYHSFQNLSVDIAPAEGKHKIVRMAIEHRADLVVFDSYAKFFAAGSQNDDAAINRAYALVLKPLRAAGIAVLRLDHTGHGEATRPAGSVQKLADVDHNWLIKAQDAPGRSARKVTLTHTQNRTGRGADLITLQREIGPLRHVQRVVEAVPEPEVGQGTTESVQRVIDMLDKVGAPLDWGRGKCQAAIKAAYGHGVKNDDLGAAIRRRQA